MLTAWKYERFSSCWASSPPASPLRIPGCGRTMKAWSIILIARNRAQSSLSSTSRIPAVTRRHAIARPAATLMPTRRRQRRPDSLQQPRSRIAGRRRNAMEHRGRPQRFAVPEPGLTARTPGAVYFDGTPQMVTERASSCRRFIAAFTTSRRKCWTRRADDDSHHARTASTSNRAASASVKRAASATTAHVTATHAIFSTA